MCGKITHYHDANSVITVGTVGGGGGGVVGGGGGGGGGRYDNYHYCRLTTKLASVPSGNNPLPEPMLIHIYVAQWRH